MHQNDKNLGLSDEDLVDVDQEVMEHAIWFTAEDTLDQQEQILLDDIENTPDSENLEDNPTTNSEQPKKTHAIITYHDLILKEEQNIHTLLKAYFIENTHKEANSEDQDTFFHIVDEFEAYFDDDILPEDEKVAKLIEAHYLFDDFLEEADIYDDNPVYFLKKTMDYPMPSDMLEKAQNMSDEEIFFLFASFCTYDVEEKEAIIKDPEKIKSKELMSVIQKLATLEQMD